MFDPSAPHIIILLVVVLLLFGSTRLPGAAQALGKSMHIFKRSVKGLDEDNQGDGGNIAQGTILPPGNKQQPLGQSTDQQTQIDALQRRLDDMQRAGDARAADPHDTRSA